MKLEVVVANQEPTADQNSSRVTLVLIRMSGS